MSITRRLCVVVLFSTLLVDSITKGFSWTWTPKSTVGKRFQSPLLLHHSTRSFSTILSKEQRSPRTSSSSTAISMVFERMSEDCILALMTAQAETKKLGLSEVTNEVLLAGIVDHPEQAKPTLVQYGITLRKITQTLRTIYSTTATSTASTSPFSMFLVQQQQQKQPTEDIPFSKPVQRTLQSASQLANHMTSPTIRSQHILLALMDYSTTSDASSGGDMKRQGSSSNPTAKSTGAIRVLQLMDERTTFSVHEFSQTLVQSMQEQQQKEEASTNKKEGVLAGGSEASSTPTLQDCGIDLTQQARAGLLDPVHGRDDEIRSSLRTLVRRRKNNPCLIGEPGVGKTAIVEGLAQILIDPNLCPPRLFGYRLVSLEMANLVAGTKYRGEFEERIQAILKEVTDEKSPPTILFIDEVHNLIGAGAAGGGDGGGGSSMDAANLLKPALSRGQLQLIGATTISEYRKYIEKDGALERRLQPILVKEPTVKQTLDILHALKPKYEKHHGVQYTDGALQAAAKLSERYIANRFLPDKAIDLLDEAGALVHMDQVMLPNLSDDDNDYDHDMHESQNLDQPPPQVTEQSVATIVSEWTSIPLGKLEDEEMNRLERLEWDMARRVKGQTRAIRSVARAIRRARSGLRDLRRPIASFLFCGTTGTGKTELCKTLAATYFNSERDMIRIDMSEYMEKHTVARLTGPPPGYIGYEEGGQLTEAVRRSPHSVVLLDELEKAHPDVISILLQVLEDGILTDGKGRTVSFKNCIIVMTSNIGSTQILAESNRHKGSSDELYSKLLSIVKQELEAGVKPEFLNRLDEIVVFSPLETSELTDIARKLLEETLQRAKEERDLDLTITDRILERVRSEGSSQAAQFGARPMRRAVQRFLEDSISDALVRGFLKPGDSGVIDLAPSTNAENQSCKVMIRKLGSVDMEDGIINTFGTLEDDDSLQSQPQILVVEVEDFSGGFGGSAPLAVDDTNGFSDSETSNDGPMTSSDVAAADIDDEGTFPKKKKKQRSDLLTETSPHSSA